VAITNQFGRMMIMMMELDAAGRENVLLFNFIKQLDSQITDKEIDDDERAPPLPTTPYHLRSLYKLLWKLAASDI